MEDGYYAWMIVATALVLMMTTPALAFFYGGMTRTKSTLNMMMMSFTAMGVVGIAFVLWGWSIGWGADGIGNGNGKLIASPLNTFGFMNCIPGCASSARMSMANMPPISRNTNEWTVYWIPMTLWSVLMRK